MRRPRWLERLLPYVDRQRDPATKSDATTITFEWDSRTYMRKAGDDGWAQYVFIGHRAYVRFDKGVRRAGTRRPRRLEVAW